MSELRVLLGDDHAVLRQGLRKILEDRRDWRVVAEAGNGRDAVREALELKPEVAVLDIGMPILNGIEATRQIARRAPNVRVVILSMHSDQAYVTQAVHAGARGYVLKESAGDELIEAIGTVAAGGTFFSPAVALLLTLTLYPLFRRGRRALGVTSRSCVCVGSSYEEVTARPDGSLALVRTGVVVDVGRAGRCV